MTTCLRVIHYYFTGDITEILTHAQAVDTTPQKGLGTRLTKLQLPFVVQPWFSDEAILSLCLPVIPRLATKSLFTWTVQQITQLSCVKPTFGKVNRLGQNKWQWRETVQKFTCQLEVHPFDILNIELGHANLLVQGTWPKLYIGRLQ